MEWVRGILITLGIIATPYLLFGHKNKPGEQFAGSDVPVDTKREAIADSWADIFGTVWLAIKIIGTVVVLFICYSLFADRLINSIRDLSFTNILLMFIAFLLYGIAEKM